MDLNDLLSFVKNTDVDNVKLYFVTRNINPEAKKSARASEKYLYSVHRVDNNDELRQYLYKVTISQLQYVIDQKYDMLDYDVLSDDTEHLFTYPIQNKMFSFQDVVMNQLQSDVSVVANIKELETEGAQLWAYCVGFEDVQQNRWIYTFRKMGPSQIVSSEKETNIFRAVFNTQSLKLELFKGQALNLDKQIDCVFFDDVFFVIKKHNFEQLVGLQEEYKELATEVAKELVQNPLFEGADKLLDLIEKKTSLYKKMVKIKRLGAYRDLQASDIKKMQKVCKKYKEVLKVEDGKIMMEDEADVDVVLKMLGDYYKMGEISGKSYGTFSGRVIKEVSTNEG